MRGFAAVALVVLALTIGGCKMRHDDGTGDLYKGVRYIINERR